MCNNRIIMPTFIHTRYAITITLTKENVSIKIVDITDLKIVAIYENVFGHMSAIGCQTKNLAEFYKVLTDSLAHLEKYGVCTTIKDNARHSGYVKSFKDEHGWISIDAVHGKELSYRANIALPRECKLETTEISTDRLNDIEELGKTTEGKKWLNKNYHSVALLYKLTDYVKVHWHDFNNILGLTGYDDYHVFWKKSEFDKIIEKYITDVVNTKFTPALIHDLFGTIELSVYTVQFYWLDHPNLKNSCLKREVARKVCNEILDRYAEKYIDKF